MRMRALDKWSAVSLATTVPSPVHGEPPRCLSDRIARLREIPRIHLVKARRSEIDADQFDLWRQPTGDLAAHVALAVEPIAVAAQGLHPHHAGNRGELCGQIVAARLDVDDMAAAENL